MSVDDGRGRPGTASWPSMPSVPVRSDPGRTGWLTSLAACPIVGHILIIPTLGVHLIRMESLHHIHCISMHSVAFLYYPSSMYIYTFHTLTPYIVSKINVFFFIVITTLANPLSRKGFSGTLRFLEPVHLPKGSSYSHPHFIPFWAASWWNMSLIKPKLCRKLWFRGHHDEPPFSEVEASKSPHKGLPSHPPPVLIYTVRTLDSEVQIELSFTDIALRLAQSSWMIRRQTFQNKLCIQSLASGNFRQRPIARYTIPKPPPVME